MTVINGPPERTRTRSPARSRAAARLCAAGFGSSISARAANDSDTLSAIPSVAAIAIELRFVNINILNSFFEIVLSKSGIANVALRLVERCWRTVGAEVAISQL